MTRHNSVSTKTSADDVTLRNIDMLGFFIEGSSNVSVIGGRVHCGACDYHPQISAEYGVNVAPTNIVMDGVLFEDWQAATARPAHRMPPDRRRQRNHDPQLAPSASAPPPPQPRQPPRSTSAGTAWARSPRNVAAREQLHLRPRATRSRSRPTTSTTSTSRYNSIAGPIVIFNREGGGTSMDFIGNNMGYASGGCTAENSGVPINWRYNVMSGGTCGRNRPQRRPTASSTATPTSTSQQAPPPSTPATPTATPPPTSTATPAAPAPRRRRRRTLRTGRGDRQGWYPRCRPAPRYDPPSHVQAAVCLALSMLVVSSAESPARRPSRPLCTSARRDPMEGGAPKRLRAEASLERMPSLVPANSSRSRAGRIRTRT